MADENQNGQDELQQNEGEEDSQPSEYRLSNSLSGLPPFSNGGHEDSGKGTLTGCVRSLVTIARFKERIIRGIHRRV
jgi:hypothetical protein